jgi:iron complex transport system permease protein
VFTAFVGSLTTAILVTDEQTLDQIRFWSVGSLAGREFPLLIQTAPYILIGLVGSFLLAHQITTLSLGEEVAAGLGQRTLWVKGLAAFMVVLLAGGSVALAGPVGFVGLAVPHITRRMVGVDYRWILPYTAILGALLVTSADMVGRVIQRPLEMPVGIMLAFVGAPFLIGLARRMRR